MVRNTLLVARSTCHQQSFPRSPSGESLHEKQVRQGKRPTKVPRFVTLKERALAYIM